jgi:hypothetical protein
MGRHRLTPQAIDLGKVTGTSQSLGFWQHDNQYDRRNRMSITEPSPSTLTGSKLYLSTFPREEEFRVRAGSRQKSRLAIYY